MHRWAKLAASLVLAAGWVCPIFLQALTVKEIRESLTTYRDSIDSLTSDFKITIDGMSSNLGLQKGQFTYSRTGGTVLKYTYPAEMTMAIKADGSVALNGVKADTASGGYQMGDIFFLYYLNHYNLKITGENSNSVALSGYEIVAPGKVAPVKPILALNYNKGLGVIDRLTYFGTGRDYPYEILADYLQYGESGRTVPVLRQMVLRLAVSSLSVVSTLKMDNLDVKLK